MIYYFDTSALLKELTYEKGSESVIDIINSGYPIYSSIVIYPEALFALRCKMQRNEIKNKEFQEGVTKFENRWQALNIIGLDHILPLLKSEVMKYPMRALDAIHLASALWMKENITLNFKIVCSDNDLLSFSTKEGLDVINPEKME